MRDDGDFSAYAVARWPSLVRTLVLLGSRPDVAARQARTALGRLREQWDRRDGLGDLDSHAYRTVLECRRQDRGAWWDDPEGTGPAPHDDGPLDPGWVDLRRRLDQLTPEERAAVVLPAVADLTPEQVEDVLGRAVGPAPGFVEALRRAADSTPVPPLVVADIAAAQRLQTRARRRRAWLVSLASLVVVAVVGGAWTWWATRPPPPPGLTDAVVAQVENPFSVGWYTDDTLHLARVELRVEALTRFAEWQAGAVYSDATGALIDVREDGRRTRLGEQRRDGSFAVSDEEGLVAWVQDGEVPELRVYDLLARELVGRTELASGDEAAVLAIDDTSVFYVDGASSYEYDLGVGGLTTARPPGLLDVARGTRVYQTDPESIQMSRDSEGVRTDRFQPGRGAQLSPEGDYVLTRIDDGGSRLGQVRIYDTRTGEEIDSGLPLDAEVFAAVLGGGGVATYLVELAQDEPDDGPRLSNSGSLQLTTCLVPEPGVAATCAVELTFPRSSTWALAQ